ncbi:VOC family protein [Marisediminicola senii]|uniref:VOC family protein n=1 Tax=Marisediminicola senii TaxID=2711233 RepID=UPI0013ECED05|nr:VOC family protein [Marisediminicola senii]
MPATTHKPSGAPVWIELSSTDTDRAATFYGAVLGLRSTDPNPALGGYRYLEHDGKTVGGLMDAQNGMPSSWVVYLRSVDIDATLARVEAAGGKILGPAYDAQDLGRMAFVQDPSGAYVGIWQSVTFEGFELEGEPGAPVWFELHAVRAWDETVAFYESVFDWTMTVEGDTDDFRMVTYGDGESWFGGLFDASAGASSGAPSSWQVYFSVADADLTTKFVHEAGGEVVEQPEDTTYGRMAAAIDPTGAQFRIMQEPPADGSAGESGAAVDTDTAAADDDDADVPVELGHS